MSGGSGGSGGGKNLAELRPLVLPGQEEEARPIGIGRGVVQGVIVVQEAAVPLPVQGTWPWPIFFLGGGGVEVGVAVHGGLRAL
jgi:hypothetical protein